VVRFTSTREAGETSVEYMLDRNAEWLIGMGTLAGIRVRRVGW
jgi:hypothetical protein